MRARINALRHEIVEQEARLELLRIELAELEAPLSSSKADTNGQLEAKTWPWPMQAEEYTRYGRQMILPSFGLSGQIHLRSAKILIIGLGGLGCPAAVYLAGAGVGTLGLVDGDTVEVSNLHRQILHSSHKVGMKKVDSAVQALRSINSFPKYVSHPEHLDPIVALDIFPHYDMILDCTDTPQTRYLISDIAVLTGKPLISASALRTDGQLMILNHPPTPSICDRTESPTSGLCYRCVFPKPPPPGTVTSCGEGGILGPVVGVMGVLMALEAIKLLSSGSSHLQQEIRQNSPQPQVYSEKHSLLMISAAGPGPATFRTIKLKGKRAGCIACGVNPTLTEGRIRDGNLDYDRFCGIGMPVSILPDNDRIKASDLHDQLNTLSIVNGIPHDDASQTNGTMVETVAKREHIIVDVRDKEQFSICALPKSINIPWSDLQSYHGGRHESVSLDALRSAVLDQPDADIVTVCRLGNDSQHAVQSLRNILPDLEPDRIKDLVGGLQAWRREVDPTWPEY